MAPGKSAPTFPAARSLPHSVDAEQHLLSCCFINRPDVISRCLEARLSPESFYESRHAPIFACLLNLYNRQASIETSVVAEELKTARTFEAVGG